MKSKRDNEVKKLRVEWAKKAKPYIVEAINNNKKSADGLKFYTWAYANGIGSLGNLMANKLKLRPDGKFDIEYTKTVLPSNAKPAAIPTIFCSAIPTFTNLSGKSFTKSSSTL